MIDPPMHIALMNPEIPGNTGNIGRLCTGVGAHLHLVHPLGFDTSEKAVRRAGLDYWRHVHVVEHADPEAFWAWSEGREMFALTARAPRSYVHAPFTEGCVLLFGRETKGLSSEDVARVGGWSIPVPGPVRSLNLSNAVAVVAYHALQQVRPGWFTT